MSLYHNKQDNEQSTRSTPQNEQLFKSVYDKYWAQLYRYAFNVLHDEDVCEDIVQEIFVSLWQKNNFHDIDHLSAYLFQSVKFQIFKHLRNGKIAERHLAQIEHVQTQTNIEDQLEVKELEDQINTLIHRLPNRCRQVFRMSRFEHRTNQEIAIQLGLSVQTVKNHISKALSCLREEISTDVYLIVLVYPFL